MCEAIPCLCGSANSLILVVRVCACACAYVCACVSLSVVIAARLTRFGRTMGRMHYDSESLKFGKFGSNEPLTHPLTHLLRTARFARTPLRSFVRSLAHSLDPELVGQWNVFVQFSMCPESQWNDALYWAIHSFARSFTRTAHSFTFSALLALLARSAALIRSSARSPFHSLPSSWERGFCL